MSLQLQPHFHRPGQRALRDYSAGDDFYEQLIDAHRDLSESQSAMLNARLILLLANHIGDLDVLREAIALARETP
jgi:predicted LPLAT superfamily acyltransferase